MADRYSSYEDGENATLMSTSMKKEKHKPDWSRFGLSEEQQQEADLSRKKEAEDVYQHHTDPSQDNELFTQDLVSISD